MGSNAVIALAKFLAGLATGNTAMLAEAVHSTVDTANEGLMLMGLVRSQRPADAQHPFGYGRELYFWTLMVAVIIFGVGGGVTMLEGFYRIVHPPGLESPRWDYVVLAIAAVFEGISWTRAYRQVRRRGGRRSTLDLIRASKDPTGFTVLLEDSAALTGLAIAALGTFFAHAFRNAAIEGFASIAIGLVLAAVAVFLVRETRGLLIGESAPRETIEDIQSIAASDPAVADVRRALTMQLAPDEVLLNIDLAFHRGGGDDVARAVDRIERSIRGKHPEVTRIFVEAQSLVAAIDAGGGEAEAERGRSSRS